MVSFVITQFLYSDIFNCHFHCLLNLFPGITIQIKMLSFFSKKIISFTLFGYPLFESISFLPNYNIPQRLQHFFPPSNIHQKTGLQFCLFCFLPTWSDPTSCCWCCCCCCQGTQKNRVCWSRLVYVKLAIPTHNDKFEKKSNNVG